MSESQLSKGLAVAVALMVLWISYEIVFGGNAGEIERVEAHAEKLEAERDSIRSLVAEHDRESAYLRAIRERNEQEATALRERVLQLERNRREGTLSVRELRRSADLEARFEETFPEIANSNWGITSIPLEPGDQIELEYLVVPVWFAETFIIDHQNAESWLEQKDNLLAVDSLRGLVSALQDSVATLHTRNALALQAGYDNASTACRDLSNRYVAELRKPRFLIGSTVGLCIGAAGAAAVVATLVNR